MAATASPYGLRPINLIGGQPYNGGAIREYYLPSNVAAAYYTGAMMYLNTNGVITPTASSPVAQDLQATSVAGTAGTIGVCVGVRYTDPILKYHVHAMYLPTGAYTAGYRDIWVKVCDDPNQLYSILADTAVGSKTNGARGAIGQNAALKTFTGSTTTGLSQTVLDTGSNWGSCAATTTLAMRIVDILTPDDTYPDVLVKFNMGLHAYQNALGV